MTNTFINNLKPPTSGRTQVSDTKRRGLRFRLIPSGRVTWAVYGASHALTGPWGAFIRILLLTGQRKSEVLGLRWDEIDLKARTMIKYGSSTSSSKVKARLDSLLPEDMQHWVLYDFRTAMASTLAGAGVPDRILNHSASGSAPFGVSRVYLQTGPVALSCRPKCSFTGPESGHVRNAHSDGWLM